jgi:hypothetical protein
MKPEPPSEVVGKTPCKRLDNDVRHIFTVSKEDVLKKEAKQKLTRTWKPTRRQAVA